MDPNRAYRDRNKAIKNVRHIENLTVECARCGRVITLNLRGVDTICLTDVRCGSCR